MRPSNMETDKADAFAAHYARISKIEFSKNERKRNPEAKCRLNTFNADDCTTAYFTISELSQAMKRTRTKSAAGSDDFRPSFLKALGPSACEEFLAIFN